jgi:hypothetical protein
LSRRRRYERRTIRSISISGPSPPAGRDGQPLPRDPPRTPRLICAPEYDLGL